jgi:hypothetical protein
LPRKFEMLQYWYYWCEGIYELAFEMGLGSIIHKPSFIKIGSGIQELIEGKHMQTHRHRQESGLISLLLLFSE